MSRRGTPTADALAKRGTDLLLHAQRTGDDSGLAGAVNAVRRAVAIR